MRMEQTVAVVERTEDTQLRAQMLSWLDSIHDPYVSKRRVESLLTELYRLFLEYRELEHLRDRNRFAIADRVLELERLLGQPAYQFIDRLASYFGYQESLLRQHLRVAELFPPETRKPGLRFSYYRMIAEMHLGTKDFAERRARALHLLEVVAAHVEAGAITSNWHDVKTVVQTELQSRGWLTPSLPPRPSDTDTVIDVSYRVEESSQSVVPVPQAPVIVPEVAPSVHPTRYVIHFTVQYGLDGDSAYTAVCIGDSAFLKTMEMIAAVADTVAYQNGVLTGLYIDSDDPIPLSLLSQLSASARALLCGGEHDA
jgi:hypothetical protein